MKDYHNYNHFRPMLRALRHRRWRRPRRCRARPCQGERALDRQARRQAEHIELPPLSSSAPPFLTLAPALTFVHLRSPVPTFAHLRSPPALACARRRSPSALSPCARFHSPALRSPTPATPACCIMASMENCDQGGGKCRTILVFRKSSRLSPKRCWKS